jgi:hypothetical protein
VATSSFCQICGLQVSRSDFLNMANCESMSLDEANKYISFIVLDLAQLPSPINPSHVEGVRIAESLQSGGNNWIAKMAGDTAR